MKKPIYSTFILLFLSQSLFCQYDIMDDSLASKFFTNAELLLKTASNKLVDTSVDNSEYLPPVGSQGSQNSCTAWAVGYYQLSHEMNKNQGWDPTLPSHQFSPAFLYNQANGGNDGGSGKSGVYKILLNQGCATLESMPYINYDYTSWPSRNSYLEAINYRIEEVFYLSQSYNQQGINELRTLLLSGKIGVMGIGCYENFLQLDQNNPIYCIADLTGNYLFRHAITIIGFDDLMVTADGVGAFKCVNSWGSTWGDQGFFWISYQLFMDNQVYHSSIYYMNLKEDYTPSLLVNFKSSHEYCSNVNISVLGGDITRQWWDTYYIYFSPVTIQRSYPEYEIPIDITDLSDYVNINTADIQVVFEDTYSDSYSGTVEFVDIESLYDTVNYIAIDVPKIIPDNGFAYIENFTFYYTSYPESLVNDAELLNNFPNPFNSVTTIEYNISSPDKVFINIFSIQGDKVKSFERDHTKAGEYTVSWDGRDNYGHSVASGIYICKLIASQQNLVHKIQYFK